MLLFKYGFMNLLVPELVEVVTPVPGRLLAGQLVGRFGVFWLVVGVGGVQHRLQDPPPGVYKPEEKILMACVYAWSNLVSLYKKWCHIVKKNQVWSDFFVLKTVQFVNSLYLSQSRVISFLWEKTTILKNYNEKKVCFCT